MWSLGLSTCYITYERSVGVKRVSRLSGINQGLVVNEKRFR